MCSHGLLDNYLRVEFLFRPVLVLFFACIVVLSGCVRSNQPAETASAGSGAPSNSFAVTASASNSVSTPTSLTEEPSASARQAPPGMQASPLESTNVLRSFAARGMIREIPDGNKSLVVRHEEIPGFMPKMTMTFEVRDANELRGLAVGDTIVFNIRATQDDSWIDEIRRAGTNDVIDSAPKDPSSVALLQVATLKPGDPMPDAELLGEDGRTVRLSDFAGKALAFTFIFTRCPLPNYCPRMNVNFKEARELLIQNIEGPSNWQFLSISFDPAFDKPGVLGRYAFSYRGAVTNQWMFAAAPTNVLAVMSPQLDFRFANEQGSFQHNLRTVVLDGRGRVHRYFEGNEWTPEELVASMTEAAAKKD